MLTTTGWRKEEELLAMVEHQAFGAGQEAYNDGGCVSLSGLVFCCVHPLKTIPSLGWAYKEVSGRRQGQTRHVDPPPPPLHCKGGKPNNQPKTRNIIPSIWRLGRCIWKTVTAKGAHGIKQAISTSFLSSEGTDTNPHVKLCRK